MIAKIIVVMTVCLISSTTFAGKILDQCTGIRNLSFTQEMCDPAQREALVGNYRGLASNFRYEGTADARLNESDSLKCVSIIEDTFRTKCNGSFSSIGNTPSEGAGANRYGSTTMGGATTDSKVNALNSAVSILGEMLASNSQTSSDGSTTPAEESWTNSKLRVDPPGIENVQMQTNSVIANLRNKLNREGGTNATVSGAQNDNKEPQVNGLQNLNQADTVNKKNPIAISQNGNSQTAYLNGIDDAKKPGDQFYINESDPRYDTRSGEKKSLDEKSPADTKTDEKFDLPKRLKKFCQKMEEVRQRAIRKIDMEAKLNKSEICTAPPRPGQNCKEPYPTVVDLCKGVDIK